MKRLGVGLASILYLVVCAYLRTTSAVPIFENKSVSSMQDKISPQITDGELRKDKALLHNVENSQVVTETVDKFVPLSAFETIQQERSKEMNEESTHRVQEEEQSQESGSKYPGETVHQGFLYNKNAGYQYSIISPLGAASGFVPDAEALPFPYRSFSRPELYRCQTDGLYYRDPISFYNCHSGTPIVQFCSPGTMNMPLVKATTLGAKVQKLIRDNFCSLNMANLTPFSFQEARRELKNIGEMK